MTLRLLRAALLITTAIVTYEEMERANAEAWLRKNGLPPLPPGYGWFSR